MNLAYKFPIMFWYCACLISDSGGTESADDEEEEENSYDCYSEEDDFDIEDFDEEDEDEDDDEEEDSVAAVKKKKKAKATNYGKVASAIGKIKAAGITVTGPDINQSSYTFTPDIENNTIRYGLSGITRIGEDLIKTIMSNRPYTTVNDFLSKIKVNKPQMVNLIKSGAFDKFGDRIDIMRSYIGSVSDTKKRITLQNMNMLIDFGLIPVEYEMCSKVYKFNKYLKKFKSDDYYVLDDIAFNFYEKNFSLDYLTAIDSPEGGFKIKQVTWDKIYQSYMDKVRPYVKEHNQELLTSVNDRLMSEMWNKYCLGSISKWEMDSVSFYSHEHELEYINDYYGISDFNKLSEVPEVDYVFTVKGREIPMFKIHRIAGTVLDKNKSKKLVTLLTPSGVVTVKIYGNVFADYDKQLSVRGVDGKKHVIEKSWFSRGNKLIITGIRQGDSFVAKKYSRTPYHLVEKIEEVYEDGNIRTVGERAEV